MIYKQGKAYLEKEVLISGYILSNEDKNNKKVRQDKKVKFVNAKKDDK